MSGNSFGRTFKITSFGESHGKAIGCIVDGCPPGLKLEESDIQQLLDKRKPGKHLATSPRKESDRVEILSGVFEGQTTGTPIALMVFNEDARSSDYDELKDVFRPGHGDYSYYQKYKIRDHRGGGRASARETVARVAAGAIALKYLKQEFNIKITAFTQQIGEIKASQIDLKQLTAPYFFADPAKIQDLDEYFAWLKEEGDSVGAKVSCLAENVPAGLGEPVFDKLDADLAKAMLSINAVKGFELGAGFASVELPGSKMRDPLNTDGFASNNAGGILAGISTGQDILLSVAFKATSSIKKPIKTIDKAGQAQELQVFGRHDACVALRGLVIVEAMTALVLLDHYLRHRGQNGHLI